MEMPWLVVRENIQEPCGTYLLLASSLYPSFILLPPFISLFFFFFIFNSIKASFDNMKNEFRKSFFKYSVFNKPLKS